MLANVGTPTSWPKHQPNVPDDVEREQTALASSFTHLHKLSVASCIALQKGHGVRKRLSASQVAHTTSQWSGPAWARSEIKIENLH